MSRINLVRVLGAVTLFGMPLLAWVLSLIFDLGFPINEWFCPKNSWTCVLVGLVYGVLAGAAASWITEKPFMRKVKSRYSKMFGDLNFTWIDVIFISICAGVGEEILFRYALQNLIGIWLAAIVFVAIHGYLNYKDKALSVYGVFMVIVSAGFGYLTVEFGLLTAIIAHASVDVYLLAQVKIENSRFKEERLEYDQDTEY